MQGPRGTKKKEFAQVLRLVNYVFREMNHQPPNMGRWYPLLFNQNNLENMRIILEDNKPVSHIGIVERELFIYGCKTKIGSIGSVCTHSEYRGRGFATILLKDSMKKMYRDGVDIVLISGGRGLYKRAGCGEVGNIFHFTVGAADREKFVDPDIEIIPYQEKFLPEMVRTYQEKSVRFSRSLVDFRMVLRTGAAMNREAETLLLQKDGQFWAYLVMWVKPKVGEVVEYAGCRSAIMQSLKHIFAKYNLEQLSFNVPSQDRELIYLFNQKNIGSTIQNIPGTAKIINPHQLMDKLHPYMEEHLGKEKANSLKFHQEKDKFSVHYGKEQFSLDEEMFTKIAFGRWGKEEKKALSGKGKLTSTLKSIFPLPLPWPGLNYV